MNLLKHVHSLFLHLLIILFNWLFKYLCSKFSFVITLPDPDSCPICEFYKCDDIPDSAMEVTDYEES